MLMLARESYDSQDSMPLLLVCLVMVRAIPRAGKKMFISQEPRKQVKVLTFHKGFFFFFF